jgi:cysteinyl-tRNA synthetase
MKKIFFALTLSIVILSLTGCDNDEPAPNNNTALDYRQAMRDFVKNLSAYAKNIDNNFIIIPQNGQELITENGEPGGVLKTDYIKAIDATGIEDMLYGYNNDDEKTPSEEANYMIDICKVFETQNIEVLVTDYCYTHSKMDDSYNQNNQNGFISFAASERNLNVIPDYPSQPYNVNSNDIANVSQAKNFLYIINSENFTTKDDFITAVSNTDYDLIIMDLFHNEVAYTKDEINRLKTKHNGGKRLVVCYMSIGEAENYRYYWQNDWRIGNPSYIVAENPDWGGNFKVQYWNTEWQTIIFGNDNSYLKKIIDTGFNGVYLDIIDGYEYFESE